MMPTERTSGAYTSFEVPVPGGALACGRWGSGDRVVVASHGITANHLSWQRVGQLVDEMSGGAVSLVAVDHRGRAGSAALPGPYGMAAHADDVGAVISHVGVDGALVAGHSMGAFVAAATAERHPTRVEQLVLVDGGLPLPLDVPPDADVETVVQSVIGPALDRLDQRWPTVDAYVDFFKAHPSFQSPNEWTDTVEDYVRLDAVGDHEGQVRSSVRKDAVLVDGGAAIVDPDSASSIERISTPSTLLWAPRGILDQTPGLYQREQIDAAVAALDHLDAVLLPDTNHYTIVVGEPGAAAVADTILRAAVG
jgi:pimeloyl-ACP methyl ester carboxylesterase